MVVLILANCSVHQQGRHDVTWKPILTNYMHANFNKRHKVSSYTLTQLQNSFRRKIQATKFMKCLANFSPQADKNIKPNPIITDIPKEYYNKIFIRI